MSDRVVLDQVIDFFKRTNTVSSLVFQDCGIAMKFNPTTASVHKMERQQLKNKAFLDVLRYSSHF